MKFCMNIEYIPKNYVHQILFLINNFKCGDEMDLQITSTK